MQLLKCLMVLSLMFTLQNVFAAANVLYPKITKVHGVVWLTGKDGKRVQVKGSTRLIEKALIETTVSAEATLELDANRSIVLDENTDISIPAISWETGESPVVILRRGSARWLEPVEKHGYNIALRSDLFEMIPPSGNVVFEMDPEKALATVKVYAGSMEFSALNGDDTVQVKEGYKVSFQGILEEGKIAYDVLLKGKKIPRGNLSAVVPLAKEDLAADEKKKMALAQQEAKARKAAELARAQARTSGQICAKPGGMFNQCAWICEGAGKKDKECQIARAGVSCVRYRCNANGDWAEKTLISAQNGSNFCKVQPVVAACDY
jgi:hypothetical protein